MKGSRIEFDPATSGASHRIIGESTQRRGLWLFAPATGNVTFSNDTPVTANNGIVMQLPQSPIYLTVDRDGDCVQREWYAVYSGVFAPASWIQILE